MTKRCVGTWLVMTLIGFPAAAQDAPANAELELVFWRSIVNSTSPAEFEAYLEQFPNGAFRRLAENRLLALSLASSAEACPDQPVGTACWRQLGERSGCFVWQRRSFRVSTSITWSGNCTNGFAQGEGTLTERANETSLLASTGLLVDGKRTGRWVDHESDGDRGEGAYVDGERNGHWVWRYASGNVEEGPYVNGERNGHWLIRRTDGSAEEGPVVDGKAHGGWVLRRTDGTIEEGPRVNGPRTGEWVIRKPDGTVEEGPYVNNERVDHWVIRNADRTVEEGAFVDNERAGEWLTRSSDGSVKVSLYLEGELVLRPGDMFKDCLECPEMVVVPGGRFRMGCGSGRDCRDREHPVHDVEVPAFALGRYEVTFAEYDRFVQATGSRRPDDKRWGRARRPVMNVSWDEAMAYVSWLSARSGIRYRLPSESEWEYAARAGTTTRYSWGDELGRNRANCDGCGSRWDDDETAPVGSFDANGWGLHDMHGNVWEWVADCRAHGGKYDNAPQDGTARTSGCHLNDAYRSRMYRGGSWQSSPRQVRSAERESRDAIHRRDFIGFRVARDCPPDGDHCGVRADIRSRPR